MIDTMMYRFILPNTFFFSKYSTHHIEQYMAINTSGNTPFKNTLNISTDGANAFISMSSTNQSNDKNVSEADPILMIGSNILDSMSGNLRLNDMAAAISCK